MIIPHEFSRSVEDNRKIARRTAERTATKLSHRIKQYLSDLEANGYVDKLTIQSCKDTLRNAINQDQ